MFSLLRSNATVRGLAGLYTGTFLSSAWAMIIPTIPVLSRYFEISAGGAAQIVTAFAIGRFVGTVIGGIVLDRIGTRAALIGGPLVGTVAALSAAAAPWLWLLLILAVAMGAADSLWATAREVAGIDLAHRHQRGRVISSLHGIYNIGAAIAPFIGGRLTDTFSFKAAFIGYAGATAVAIFLGFAGPDSRVVALSTAQDPQPAKGWGFARVQRWFGGVVDVFRQIRPELRPTYLVLCLATLVSQSQRMIVQSMLPLYAASYLQLSPTEIGVLFSISGVVVFAMIIPTGFLMDRVGRKWCTVPSTGLPALVFVLIPFTTSFIQLSLLVGLAGLAQGLSLGSIATSTYDVVPTHVRGRLQAARRTVAEAGSAVAPLFGGYLANSFNPGVPFLAYAPLLLISATLLGLVGKETLER